jgi:hypothetical protein
MNAITLLFLAATAAAQTSGFDVYADGATLHRLEGRGGAILHRRSGDGGRTWSAPARVDAGRPKAYHLTAGDMRVAAAGDLLLAVWSADGEGPHGSGPLVMARSEDAGKTWKPAASPAGKGKAGRRFPALAAAGGRFVAAWIDRSSNAKLLASTSEDGGRSWTPPAALDEDICECCWNTAHASGGTVSVLFRDKDPRDMKVASSTDGGKTWSIAPAGPQGWKINSCPHAGGALAGDAALHALSYTGREGAMGLHVGPVGGPQSRLGGENAKHADLAGAGGRLAAAWTEEGAVWAAVSEDGKAWSEPRRLSAEKKKVSQPRVSAAGAGFRAFWLEQEGDGPARLRETALP